ncbi:MAG: hypothetical protein GY829_12900 [Gammaproteobacteria bacterium]|nr:hypothetical protein [Gammaproteobacteria bacterium]
MYDFDKIENYVPAKNTTNYTFFALCILVSFSIHLLISIFIRDSTFSCFNCYKVSEAKTKSLSIQLYKEPAFIPPVEIVEDFIEQKSEPLREIIKSNESPLIQPKPIIVESILPLSNIKKINYATLSSSIENVIYEDSQKHKKALQENCEDIKRNTKNSDCVPIIERLGYKTDDPHNLAKIFSRLSNQSSNKQQDRIIAQLISKQDTILSIIENENLDEDTRAIFNDELAFLRGEVQYQDCDGNLTSGNCAGEIDLFKTTSLLLALFEKIIID